MNRTVVIAAIMYLIGAGATTGNSIGSNCSFEKTDISFAKTVAEYSTAQSNWLLCLHNQQNGRINRIVDNIEHNNSVLADAIEALERKMEKRLDDAEYTISQMESDSHQH